MRCHYCGARFRFERGPATCPACHREQPEHRPLGVALWAGGWALTIFGATVQAPGRLDFLDRSAQAIIAMIGFDCLVAALLLGGVIFVRWLWLTRSLKHAVGQLLLYLFLYWMLAFNSAAPESVDFPN